MTYPLIGITTLRILNEQGYPRFAVNEAYSDALIKAGAIPVLIPLGLPEELIDPLVDKLDGVLFTGGGDIDPEIYGQPTDRQAREIDLDRDQIEIRLLKRILTKGLPFFGVCRGLQIINVALGGDLYSDILSQHEGAIEHQYYPGYRREFLAHTVKVSQNSMLATIFPQTEVQVNSLHHQGVRRLAPQLQISATAPDGIIEAFELKGYPFGLAVQWHPENLQADRSMRDLFQLFVKASVNIKE